MCNLAVAPPILTCGRPQFRCGSLYNKPNRFRQRLVLPKGAGKDDNNEVGEKTSARDDNENGSKTGMQEKRDRESSLGDGEKSFQLPRSTINKLRDEVFSLDTFFVTSVENYGTNGVVFGGNLRGDTKVTIATLRRRLAAAMDGDFELFLLKNREDSPVVVVIPAESANYQSSDAVDVALFVLLSLASVATTVNVMGGELFNAALLEAKFDPSQIENAIPGSIAALSVLVAHEVAHRIAAAQQKIDLAPPIPIPAGLGLLGSFGCITRFKSIVPDREILANVAVSGPLVGSGLSLVLMLAGILLTATGQGGVELETQSFRESFLVGLTGQLLFGDRLFTAETLDCNPVFIAGWAGLIINAINCIPAGELDGGRIFLSLFGRQAAAVMSIFSFIMLSVGSFVNGLALFWLLLVLTIQRGPTVPCQEEISDLEGNKKLKFACIFALLIPLFVLLPFPISNPAGLQPF